MQWHRNRFIQIKICSLGPLPYKAEKQQGNLAWRSFSPCQKSSLFPFRQNLKARTAWSPSIEYWVLQWAACWIHRKGNVPLIQDKVRTCSYHIKKAESWKSEQCPKNISLATSKEFWLAESSVKVIAYHFCQHQRACHTIWFPCPEFSVYEIEISKLYIDCKYTRRSNRKAMKVQHTSKWIDLFFSKQVHALFHKSVWWRWFN